MKTIRRRVFETNSSSTHSITITGKSDRITSEVLPLVEDGVIYPERLSSREIDILKDSDISFLVCRTKEEKTALLLNWLSSSEDTFFEIEEIESFRDKVAQDIAIYCGFVSAVLPKKWYGYSCYDDGNNPVDEYTTLESFINEVVLDDSIKIIQSDIPY